MDVLPCGSRGEISIVEGKEWFSRGGAMIKILRQLAHGSPSDYCNSQRRVSWRRTNVFAAFEEYAVYIVIAGLVALIIGWIALIAAAFRVGKAWGYGALLMPPVALLFIPKHYGMARRPLLFILWGLIIGSLPYLVSRLGNVFIDLGPYERMVEGELHLTLTGWDRKDYSVLKARPGTVVLQMANSDVDDATLELILPMAGLKELDLNDTAITDAGLAKLAAFKNLKVLRLRNTKVTDAAFQKWMASLEHLMEVDVRGTTIAPETIRQWRQAKTGRKAMVDRPPARPTPAAPGGHSSQLQPPGG